MKKKTKTTHAGPRPSSSAKRPAAGAKKPASGRARSSGARKKPLPAGDSVVVSREAFQQMREQLREAQETLQAIRNGETDALVVASKEGDQVYSLAGAEQPYRVYVERMEEGAVTVSAEGVVLYCNQRFAEMARLPLGRMIGSEIAGVLPAGEWKHLGAVFSGREEFTTAMSELVRAGETPLPVKLTASRLPIGDRDVMCLVVTDLTAQRQHEEMRLAKEVAERSSLAKDAFLAALSHELRTPLSPVLTTTMALAQDHSLPHTVRQQLEVIRRNVELEARLIDDLLDLTRIARGKLELRSGPVDLHAILENAIEICAADLGSKQQQLRMELGAAGVDTEGDATRLQQAMWNLIRNAVKFTPAGGEIVIRTGNRERTLWLEVSDNGIGFEPERREEIFQAFEQGGRHITRQFGGLGLGLAITKSLVEAHGGSIRAESDGVGKGARFTLEVPLKKTNGSHPPMPVATVEKPRRLWRILLVEDHKDTRAAMERWLRRSRHDVASADSAEQALRVAEAGSFDLVISDLGLPDQSGLELMQELRKRHGLRGIAVSGYGMEEDVVKSREAGFVHHLTKPVSLEKLGALLAGWTPAPVGEQAPGAPSFS